LQLHTVDHFLKTLVVVGYATLNIFVESGTEKQPHADTGVQVFSVFSQRRHLRYGASEVF